MSRRVGLTISSLNVYPAFWLGRRIKRMTHKVLKTLLETEFSSIFTAALRDISSAPLSKTQKVGVDSLTSILNKFLELKMYAEAALADDHRSTFSVSAMENVSDGIVTQDATGAIVYSNPAAQITLGLSADELEGRHSTDSDWQSVREDGTEFPGIDHPAMVCLRTGEKQLDVVFGIHRPTKEVRWLNVNSVPLFCNGIDKASHVVSSFADITEQINTKKKMRADQSALRLILNSVPAMIALWDTNLINLEANDAYIKYKGVKPQELKGMHFREALGEALFQLNKENIDTVMKGHVVNFHRVQTDSSGQDIHFDGTYVPNIVDGNVVSFLTVLVDITRIKTAETERQKLETQLMEASRLSALGELAAGIAHEVNNPLGIIIGRVNQLKEKFIKKTIDPEIDMKYITVLENTAARISKIIKGLRTYSRNAENDPFDPIKVRGIIDDSLVICADRINAANVRVTVTCDPNLEFECRPAQISQVLVNLIINSCDAIAPLADRWLCVDVFETGSNVHIKCVDSGRGIPANIAENIMQPFFTTKVLGKGTGLGLSVSMGIAHCHNGKLIYMPNETNTTFILEIPKSQPKAIQLASVKAA